MNTRPVPGVTVASIPITALVLVGGLGTRLKSVVSDRPKALAPVGGRPFLAWQLESLANHGVCHVVLCTHHLADMIEDAFPSGLGPNGMTVTYAREPEPLGTGGALRMGLEAAPTGVGPILGLNGDTFCDFALADFLAFHQRSESRASLLLVKVEDASRYGTVTCDESGRITAFHEKAEHTSGPSWVSAGIYLLERPLLASLPLGRPTSIERDAFPSWIGQGLWAFQGGRRFLDIGTPESYAAAEHYLEG